MESISNQITKINDTLISIESSTPLYKVVKESTLNRANIFKYEYNSAYINGFNSCKKLPSTSLQCCYIFLVLLDHWLQQFKCWKLSNAQSIARELEGCCTFLFSLMYRLNQTQSAIFIVILLWLMLPPPWMQKQIFLI
jgi:hypothetical protein